MRIAISLSGGGVRATVFHLGVLGRLAKEDLLGNVRIISSVSGGSLAAGLIFTASGMRWPSSRSYLRDVVPGIADYLTGCDLQRRFIAASCLRPWQILHGRASILGRQLHRHWNIDGNLKDLPIAPRWIINATCYQTGKNWRFERDMMGDYQTKYVLGPDLAIADAMAASAAVPGLVGPLEIRCDRYRWTDVYGGGHEIQPRYRQLHLWDGGVYDNLGTESLFKPSEGICDGADFLIVSDASRPVSTAAGRSFWRPGYLAGSMRLIDVATDQVRSLRARMLVRHFRSEPGSGVYLKMGRPPRTTDRSRGGLDKHSIKRLSNLETTLRRLTAAEFGQLFRHGYEVATESLRKHASGNVAPLPRRAAA